jgi:hypothetical protein
MKNQKINLLDYLKKEKLSSKVKKLAHENNIDISMTHDWKKSGAFFKKINIKYWVSAEEEAKKLLQLSSKRIPNPNLALKREAGKKRKLELKLKMEKFKDHPFFDRKYFDILALNLSDVYSANLEWLEEALESYCYSFENNGIMKKWLNSCESIEHLSFYECLVRAMKARNRHENTDYDFLLKSGCDREEARELIRIN